MKDQRVRPVRQSSALRKQSLLVGVVVALWLMCSAPATAADDPWAQVLSVVADSVVSLKISHLRNFDDSRQGGSNATGFVVDAERGIVLTNRHVVGSGPIRISATFQNQERVDAVPLYRDPVHDFAFIRYDPADLEYARPLSLSLRPDKVRTGMNVRVIGSDGGEQLSILTGTIARLDREVPSYGRYGYNDFNTFYLQAASSTSGGSSGSPVIDFEGDVVALNAAANAKTASSFFLPLDRIQTALAGLQADQAIPRGTLQTLYRHTPFRELLRLGLSVDLEKKLRSEHPKNTGMLVVSQVIAGGVADEVLEEGDILLSIDDQTISDFLDLETLLDARIGRELSVELVRQGELTRHTLSVVDLHAIEPRRFIELGNSVLQNMSIQHARAMNLPQRGVVLGDPGYFFTRAGVPRGSVLTMLDGQPLEHLDDLLGVVSASPRDQELQVRYIVPGREFVSQVAQIDIDSRWFGHRECVRRDDQQYWDCQDVLLDRPEPAVSEMHSDVPGYDDTLLDRVAPAMVLVDFDIPYPADNVYARHFKGVGIVVDREAGIVAVDRNTVPSALGDVEITFFGTTRLDASVVFLHPRHNIALLQYDPTRIADAQFEALTLAPQATIDSSAGLSMIGYRSDGTFRRHAVNDVSPLTVSFDAPGLPRFQQAPIDVFSVPNMPPSLGGPLVDQDGIVQGLYMSFAYEDEREIRQHDWVMPATQLIESIRLFKAGNVYRSLDATLEYRSIAEARQLGLSDEWLGRYRALEAGKRRVLYVEQTVPMADTRPALENGDVLIALDGALVTDLFDVDRRSQREHVQATVLRNGTLLDVEMQPRPVSGLGTRRLVSWAGALFQAPHPDIGFQKAVNFPGVYITATENGSPAIWDSLYRNRFVTAVDGVAIKNLDDFIEQIADKQQDEITRLSVVSMSGRKRIVTVQPEYNFWPTRQVVRSSSGWQRINL